MTTFVDSKDVDKLFQFSLNCIERAKALFPNLYTDHKTLQRSYSLRLPSSSPQQQISRRASLTSDAFRDASAPSLTQNLNLIEQELLSRYSNRPIGERFTAEEHKVLNSQFNQMDSKRDGVIDIQEFVESLGVLGINKFAKYLFRACDIDNSGFIEFSDFKYSVGVLTRGTERERLKCG